MWERLPAHAPQLLSDVPVAVGEWMVVTGIATATYGTHLEAALNTWRAVQLRGWVGESCNTFGNLWR